MLLGTRALKTVAFSDMFRDPESQLLLIDGLIA
jgi:hypothetical protein